MARLAQLLASHRRILVLDAASTRVGVGLLQRDGPALWELSDVEAGRSIFQGTANVLARSGGKVDEVDAFVYCSGPGSMLGVRTVAMAIRSWLTLAPRPVYRYQSLALAAYATWQQRPRALTLIADARRDAWHAQGIAADGTLGPLQRLPAASLPAGELLMPERFRAWSTLPPATRECAYDLPAAFRDVTEVDLFSPDETPDAFQHQAPEYQKWSAQGHSAETAAKR